MNETTRWPLAAAALLALGACGSTPAGGPRADAAGPVADAAAAADGGPDAAGPGAADAAPRPDAVAPADAAPPADAGPHQIEFDALFRAFRMSLGMDPVPQDGLIREAAGNHCFYCANNPADCGLRESNPDGVGYTGEQFWDRLLAVGYLGEPFIEVMSFFNNPQEAFDSWVASLYHRIPLVSYLSSAYGYADGPGCSVGDFARAEPGAAAARSHWPLDGATGIPLALSIEAPELMPGPLGYPVSLHAGAPLVITLHTFEEVGGPAVTHYLVDEASDPNHYVTAYEVFLVPAAPLSAATTYRVTVAGTQGGAPFSETWSFTTR